MRKSSDPVAQLMQEHNEALVQLKILNKASQTFSQNGFSKKTYRQIISALKFIEKEVTEHNRKEEQALFPVLERYVDGPTRIMRNDHKKLRKGFVQLRQRVREVRKRKDSFSAIKQMSTVAKSVVHLFVNHIHKENYILFPLVQQFLNKDELREVAKKML